MNKSVVYIVLLLLMFGCVKQDTNFEISESGSPPNIVYFNVSPNMIKIGESARLEWLVENATSVNIEGIGNVPNSGSIIVKPRFTTTYKLNAFNENGKSTKSIILEVQQYEDKDGDGYTEDVDCNDENKNVHPDANEVCNGIDDNCNGLIDDNTICEDDGNPCTKEECINATCIHKPLNNIPCDDGNPLTINDMCVDGVCTGTEI